MIVRQATSDDLPYLKQRLQESGGEQIDLDMARVWVAVEDERIVGMLPLRLIWQAEPLLLWGETQSGKRRAGIELYRAMEAWLSGPENKTGIRWLFAVTRSAAVAQWLLNLGWFRQYAEAKQFLKYL